MKIIQPRRELRSYVRYYWILKSDKPLNVLTFPIGCPQIIFHRKTPIYIPELSSFQSRFTISGQVNYPSHICSDGNLDMIVAVFYPHTIGMFINTSPSAFYNLEISGSDISDNALNDVAARVLDCADDSHIIAVLEAELLSRIKSTLNCRRIGSSVEMLMRSPWTSVGTLADEACLGKKQFERVFREQVGMNPKEYIRVVRFQKSLRMLQCGTRNYAGIAAECGYADQSHFIREFKSMSGHTPKSLCTYTAPYSDLFTQPQLSEY